ncbi:MAG: hypothetical protein COB67_13565 [SAR324 cluster bacterium]|uniref:Transglycosylase SLT domain-containing protein n=1 Tax=SAR324 cluster bacterium TaxID=2024889 RepID=A0A2A4SL87_9DELT|nr:MAG: hypothetical protein COB67_13565 [SAR324 cluster bacterium]
MRSYNKNNFYTALLLLLVFVFVQSCGVSSRRVKIKDNKRKVWSQYNARIAKFYKIYNSNQTVKSSLKKAQPYLPYIHKVFRRYQLPPELVYLPMLESAFNPKAVSRTGARGLWQFKKATGEEYGLNVNWYRDERNDWKKSTHAAARYLKKLGERFNYNWELALAGYNGGPTYLSKTMKKQHSWNYWNLKLKKEPSQYVPKFLAMLRVAKKKYPKLFYKGAKRY